MKFAALFLFALTSLMAERPRFASGYMYSYYVPPSASTPWRPAWSPDGKDLVFGMSGSLWRIRVGDTTAYELTSNRTYDSSPSYSPDGRFIAYTTEDSTSVNLMLLNVATGESTALTRGAGINLDPAWSPDGQRMAWVRNEPRGQYHIFMMTFDNGRPGAPQRMTEPNNFGRARLYFSAFDDHISPTFSPDGRELILVSNRGIPLGSGALWRAPAQPNLMSKAKMILREETLYRTQPQWSRDGKRLLYSSHRGSQYNNLFVLPVEGGEPYQLTFGNWDHFDPRWSPDGEWIAYISNRKGNSELRLLRTFGGEDKAVEIRRRAWKRPMATLEVRLAEATRIYLTASDGKTYTPDTSYHRVSGRYFHRDFFHAEGVFRVEVPPGEVTIEAAKGLEYTPIVRKIQLEPGSTHVETIELERMASMRAAGWYSGSDHVHMNYGGNLHNTPANLFMMARAEDLNMIGEKVANKDNRIFDHHHYTGAAPHRLSGDTHIMTIGEEYRPPFYGHINFINLTGHLISPYTTGYEGTAIESLYPSNTDMFRLGRQQGALAGYVHPFSRPPEESTYAVARGFPVDLALGSFEYLELMTSAGHFTNTVKAWHRALNCGFKVTASAGEDSILNLHATPILGSARLYAYLGPKLEWSAWLDAIRKGRTFVTNGPLLRFDIDGEIAGGEIKLPASGGSVMVNARVDSIVPLEKLELFFNGKVVEAVDLAGKKSAHFSKRIPVTTSGWFTLRASNSKPQHPVDDSYVVGETSPIYVYTGDKAIRSLEDAQYFIRWIDDITRQAEQHPGWRSDKEKQHVLGQFKQARQVFVERSQQ